MVVSRAAWMTAGGLALMASVAWVALSRSGDPPPPQPAAAGPGDTGGETARLRAALEEERARATELAREVEWLRAQLALIAEANGTPPDFASAPPPEASGAEDAGAEPEEDERLWFDGDALVAGGVPPYDVERLREKFDASEMELIALENQARREGWFDTRQYRQSLRDLRIGLREEIGDEAYDQLLFATGRDNRVVIADVLRDSPGARAGLEPGDVLLSYGGSRVFRAGELKRATTQGKLGDRVAIDLLRDGERRRIYAERGPIGARLRPGRGLPDVR